MADSTHRAEVVPVSLLPHPNADTLSLVKIKGYTCCVRTADWQGVDRGVYIQPDTIVPDTPEFSFLKKGKDDPKHLRIRVQRLRGYLSQGLLWPVPPAIANAQLGDDLSTAMGLAHYEPPLPQSTGGECERGPSIWVPRYDVETFYNFPNVISDGEEVVITEKIHGANGRWVFSNSEPSSEEASKMYCGSHTEWKAYNPKNMWWRALQDNPWIEEFCRAHPNHVMYGEVYGNVQKLKYGIQPNQPNSVKIFDILYGNEYLSLPTIHNEYKFPIYLHWAPILYMGPFHEELALQLATGSSQLADHLKEGVVVGTLEERMDFQVGRAKLKIVSKEYLEKD